MAVQPVDSAVVAHFLVGVDEFSVEQLREVIARLGRQIGKAERITAQNGHVNDATLEAIIQQLADVLYQRGAGCWYCTFGAWPEAPRCAHI